MPKRERGGALTPIVQELEQLLQRYLTERGWREGIDWVWEQIEFDGMRPDAVLLDESGNPIAVYEATLIDAEPLLEFTKSAREDYLRGASSSWNITLGSLALSKALQRKAPMAQAVAASAVPFMLVVESEGLSHTGAETMPNYPAVSAVASLAKQDPLVLVRALSSEAATEREVTMSQSLRIALSRRYGYDPLSPPASAGETLRRLGTVPAIEVTAMHIYLNPHAQNPWTSDLWGVYDVVWGWNEQTRQYEIVYDGRWELLKTYRLFLRAGGFDVKLREGISTSRSENFYEERE